MSGLSVSARSAAQNCNIGALPKHLPPKHLPRCEEVAVPETTTCPCMPAKPKKQVRWPEEFTGRCESNEAACNQYLAGFLARWGPKG
jgi:hypothetical protein